MISLVLIVILVFITCCADGMLPSQPVIQRNNINGMDNQYSDQPTHNPSQLPSKYPTRAPSRQPSTRPTRKPSYRPTSQSSGEATATPTNTIVIPSIPDLTITPTYTEHILSVTVRIHCSVNEAIIYYTTDGSDPTETSQTVASDSAIVIDQIGHTIVKAFAVKEGMSDSRVAAIQYNILDKCSPPQISPRGGTFADSVVITLITSTESIELARESSICYSLNGRPVIVPTNGVCVSNGTTVTVGEPGRFTMRAIVIREGSADSNEVSASFDVRTQVIAPVISPSLDIFAISATLIITCATPDATIYYTTDGSDPDQSSLTVGDEEQNSVVIDTEGNNVVKAFATVPNMLPSPITVKQFTILERLSEPHLEPASGTYTGDVKLRFDCVGTSDSEGGMVYYTTDGVSTPTVEENDRKTLHTTCSGQIQLLAPGTIVVRVIVSAPNKAPSAVLQAKYTLVRPAYDEYPVNAAYNHYSVQPDVEIVVVEKDIKAKYSYCEEQNIRGRLIKLRNPVGHFDIVPPANGCSSGELELPSVSGRKYKPPPGFNLSSYINIDSHSNRESTADARLIDAASTQSESCDNYCRNVGYTIDQETKKYGRYQNLSLPIDIADSRAIPWIIRTAIEVNDDKTNSNSDNSNIYQILVSKLEDWAKQYDEVKDYGCEVVTNAGFFNTTSNVCFGDIITDGVIHQLSDKHNVNFGIRNGSFVTGYIENEEILDQNQPKFDFLISGIGWLVRDGRSYVLESFSTTSGDGEDMSSQTTGTSFITVKSARTALGHDKDGNLLLLQIEGETWVRGMNLYDFAEFLIELGFVSAINLDGGGSATMTQNHTLVSEPSWKCVDPPYNYSESYRCEKRVASITCIHAMTPPFVDESVLKKFTTRRNGFYFPTAVPTEMPHALPTTDPTSEPTAVPTYTNHDGDGYDVSAVNVTLAGWLSPEEEAELRTRLLFFEFSAGLLAIALLVSVTMHIAFCTYNRYSALNKNQRSRTDSYSKDSTEDVEEYGYKHDAGQVAAGNALNKFVPYGNNKHRKNGYAPCDDGSGRDIESASPLAFPKDGPEDIDSFICSANNSNFYEDESDGDVEMNNVNNHNDKIHYKDSRLSKARGNRSYGEDWRSRLQMMNIDEDSDDSDQEVKKLSQGKHKKNKKSSKKGDDNDVLNNNNNNNKLTKVSKSRKIEQSSIRLGKSNSSSEESSGIMKNSKNHTVDSSLSPPDSKMDRHSRNPHLKGSKPALVRVRGKSKPSAVKESIQSSQYDGAIEEEDFDNKSPLIK